MISLICYPLKLNVFPSMFKSGSSLVDFTFFIHSFCYLCARNEHSIHVMVSQKCMNQISYSRSVPKLSNWRAFWSKQITVSVVTFFYILVRCFNNMLANIICCQGFDIIHEAKFGRLNSSGIKISPLKAAMPHMNKITFVGLEEPEKGT